MWLRFRGCGLFLYLDTDSNLPAYDFDPATLKPIAKDPLAGDGDACRTAFNLEYELRRSAFQVNSYFNIYPSPGDGERVIFIQNRDRQTACPDRSFLQWSEAHCAVTKNLVKHTYNVSELYQPEIPTLAKVDLVGPLQASKWKIQFPTSDVFANCGGLSVQNMRIAPFEATPSCKGKWLSVGSPLDPTTDVFNVGISGLGGTTSSESDYYRVTFFTPENTIWVPPGVTNIPCGY